MMSEENIIAIIKWGPLIYLLLALLIGMLVGLINGRRKALRRTIYVGIFLILSFFLTPVIVSSCMGIQIQGATIQEHINQFILNNETVNNLFNGIPALKEIILQYPVAIVSLILFVVLIFVILPLSFPIYWIYLIFYTLIEKYVFKYQKYEKDDNGEILRNEKNKKIKIKKDKHRLTGAIMMGTQYSVLASTIFVPIGVVTRLYQDANNATSNKNLSSLDHLQDYKQYLNYLDAFNNSIVGKVTNSAVNKVTSDYLTSVEINGTKSTLENELSNIAIAAVYLEESGLIPLLTNKIDINTLDLSKVNMNMLNKAIGALFETATLNATSGSNTSIR